MKHQIISKKGDPAVTAFSFEGNPYSSLFSSIRLLTFGFRPIKVSPAVQNTNNDTALICCQILYH